jgi:small membrane protein
MIVPVLLAGLALILAYIGSHRSITRFQLLFIAAFFAAGAIMVLHPEMANRVAALMNVGRGADLLMYFAVLCGVLVCANFYFRFKQNEQVVTTIVRQLALLSPMQPSKEESWPKS